MNSFIGIVLVVVLIAVSLISISFTAVFWIRKLFSLRHNEFDVLSFFEDKEKDR